MQRLNHLYVCNMHLSSLLFIAYAFRLILYSHTPLNCISTFSVIFVVIKNHAALTSVFFIISSMCVCAYEISQWHRHFYRLIRHTRHEWQITKISFFSLSNFYLHWFRFESYISRNNAHKSRIDRFAIAIIELESLYQAKSGCCRGLCVWVFSFCATSSIICYRQLREYVRLLCWPILVRSHFNAAIQ